VGLPDPRCGTGRGRRHRPFAVEPTTPQGLGQQGAKSVGGDRLECVA
jgi:hypothetical protein